jgi:hypothetical protein
MRCLLPLLSILVACGGGSSVIDGGNAADATQVPADAGADDGDGGGDPGSDAGVPDAAGPDAFTGTFDITIFANDDCTITTVPPSLSVPAGTEFTVTWFNSAQSIEVDLAKVDQFNQVPLILGFEPGTTYQDSDRWCGSEFTGLFDFRVISCGEPHYLPVDCGAGTN